MKKIIAFTSFLFLFLLATLSGYVTPAAAATNTTPVLKGISLVKTDGSEIKAAQSGQDFTFDLYKLDGKQELKEYRFYSDTARTVSLIPPGTDLGDVQINVDDYDLQFVNGVATLDKQKFTDWLNRQLANGNTQLTEEELQQIQENVKSLFTVQGIRDTFASGEEVPLYVYDAIGNKTDATVKFLHGWRIAPGLGWTHYNDNGQLTKGWFYDDFEGVWYYLNPSNGVMKTGWLYYKSSWYFLKSSGAMADGEWILDKGKWYYLNPKTGAMKTRWLLDDGKWYYLDKTSGAMKTGWVKDGGKWYFLSKSGVMKTGWVYDNYRWYYLNNPNGSMATGWVKVNGKWYYLYSDGHMAKNTKIGRYVLGADGAMK